MFYFTYNYNATYDAYQVLYVENGTTYDLGTCYSHEECQARTKSHLVICATQQPFQIHDSCQCSYGRTGEDCLQFMHSYTDPTDTLDSVLICMALTIAIITIWQLYKLHGLRASDSNSVIHVRRTLLLVLISSLGAAADWMFDACITIANAQITEADRPFPFYACIIISEFLCFTLATLNVGIIWLIAAERSINFSPYVKARVKQYQGTLPFFYLFFGIAFIVSMALNELTWAIITTIPAFLWVLITTSVGSYKFYRIYCETKQASTVHVSRQQEQPPNSTTISLQETRRVKVLHITRRVFIHGILVSTFVFLTLIFFLTQVLLDASRKRTPWSLLHVFTRFPYLFGLCTLATLVSYMAGVVQDIVDRKQEKMDVVGPAVVALPPLLVAPVTPTQTVAVVPDQSAGEQSATHSKEPV